MTNPLQLLFEFSTSFYSTMESLYIWFSTDITLLDITFCPFDIIFSWGTLSVILLAVMVKKLVPVA